MGQTIIHSPLPIRITTSDKSINIGPGAKLFKRNSRDLRELWGYKKVKIAENRVEYTPINKDSEMFKYFQRLMPWDIISWNWFLEYKIPPMSEPHLYQYILSSIKVFSDLSVDAPCMLIYNGKKFIDLRIIDIFYYRMFPFSIYPVKNIKSLKAGIDRYDEDKNETSNRLIYATRNLQLNRPAYISELIAILDKLYGVPSDSKYRFKVNILLANPKLAGKKYWDILHKAYTIRSGYSHGKKPKYEMTENEFINLQKVLKISLIHYFIKSGADIKKMTADGELIKKLTG